jgi:lipoprotein NlpI
MKFTVLGALTLTALLLSACSTSQPMWRKPNVTMYESNNTLAKCRYDIGLAKVNQNEKQEMIKDCMNAQGFRYTNY